MSTAQGTTRTHTLSVLVMDRPGVLTRIAGLFSRRGFNIQSLAVGPTEQADLSRITIVAAVDDLALEQLTKQLNKLVEVLKIVELDGRSVQRELVLVKVACTAETRGQVLEIVNMFRCRSVDVAADSLTIEVTGGSDKIEALLQLLEPYGIKELAQSGMVALARGGRGLSERGGRPDRNRPIRIV